MSERLTTPEEAVCFKLGVALTMERIVLEMLVAFEERAQREEVKHVLRRPADEARLHLARVETSFQILGYPGLAIICFLVAAGGGLWLVFNILWQDHKSKMKSRR